VVHCRLSVTGGVARIAAGACGGDGVFFGGRAVALFRFFGMLRGGRGW
jgi:hypothetical protein